MERWVWLAAYVVGFVLLQVYLYRYFIKRSSTGERATPESTADGTPALSEGGGGHIDQPEEETTGDLICCTDCGGYNQNEQMYTFCKHCGNRLQ